MKRLNHIATVSLCLSLALIGACSTTRSPSTKSGGATAPANASVNNTSARPSSSAQAAMLPEAGNLASDPISPVLSAEKKREQEKLLHRKLMGQMMDQGSWYAALAHCDAYDQQWGVDIQSRLLRADAQRMTGQLDVAQGHYQALRNTSLKSQALHGLSQIAAQRGQWAEASNLLSEAIRSTPLNPRLYNDQGLLLTLLNKPQEAFVALRKSQELAPDKNLAKANLALYAAVYDEEALFASLTSQLNWKDGDINTVRNQALRIRAAHRNGQSPNPDIFSGR